MCGRYTLTVGAGSDPGAVSLLRSSPTFPPRYNVAPTQPIAIVRLVDGKRQFALVRWGLLPSWVKDPKTFTLLINARGESVTEKPAFRAAMKRRRCLIPADGFYEWQAAGARKQPFYVRAKSGAPLAFAGLWETWTGPNGEELETAAIVTTARQPHAGADPRTHAGDRAAGGVRSLARLRRGRRRDRGGADRAGAGRSARGLRGFDRGQPHRQRQSETG